MKSFKAILKKNQNCYSKKKGLKLVNEHIYSYVHLSIKKVDVIMQCSTYINRNET